MCTYSRKKNATLIDGVENLCRLCLGDLGDPVLVFSKENELCSFLSFRIMLSTGIKFSHEANLPNAICKQCHEQVESSYTFRKRCQGSYRKLQSHLQALKNKKCAELESGFDESLKERNNSDEEKLVLNFEKDGVAELVNYTPVDVGVFNEKKVEKCEENKLVIEEKMEILEQFNEHQKNTENCKESRLMLEEKVNVLHAFHGEKAQAEVSANSNIPTIVTTVEADDIKPNMEISSFLSTILVDLGVLSKYGDCVELNDCGVMSLELEMNEDNLISLEIVEEDQEMEVTPVVEENKSNDVKNENCDSEQNIVIQYVTGGSRKTLCKNNKLAAKRLEDKKDVKTEDPRSLVLEKNGKREGGDRAKATCSECRKCFTSLSSLRRHRRVHSGERPHVCKMCDRRFAQAAVLNRHRLTHLEKRPFQCDSCDKSFTQRSGLLAHARAHRPHNKRPLHLHTCPLCTKVFLYPSGLSRHMSTHEGRVYMCGDCGKSFNDKSSLLRHLRTCKRQSKDAQTVR